MLCLSGYPVMCSVSGSSVSAAAAASRSDAVRVNVAPQVAQVQVAVGFAMMIYVLNYSSTQPQRSNHVVGQLSLYVTPEPVALYTS